MNHLELELNELRQEVINMWNLVINQIDKSQNAIIQFDKDLAREVIQTEKRINALELKIDKDCENIIALFNPVAVDLRLVLANLKINSNLERIADIAEGISKYVKGLNKPIDKLLIEESGILKMYAEVGEMMSTMLKAYEEEDSKLARTVFKMDEQVDEINKSAILNLTQYISKHNDQIEESLYILSIIRKLERVGDQIKNLAEELIFHVDAKVLKHTKKKSSKNSGLDEKKQ